MKCVCVCVCVCVRPIPIIQYKSIIVLAAGEVTNSPPMLLQLENCRHRATSEGIITAVTDTHTNVLALQHTGHASNTHSKQQQHTFFLCRFMKWLLQSSHV